MTPRISSISQLKGWPAGLRADQFAFAMVESATEVKLLDWSRWKDAAGAYSRGTAFSKQAEMRWLRRDNGLHLVLISDAGECLPGAVNCAPLDFIENANPAQVLLWGEWDGTEFFDNRIPGDLNYAACSPKVSAGWRLAVRLRHYEFEWAGKRVRISRYAGIATVEKPV